MKRLMRKNTTMSVEAFVSAYCDMNVCSLNCVTFMKDAAGVWANAGN